MKCNADGEVEDFKWGCKQQHGTLGFENLSISTSHMFATALFAWSDDGMGRFVRSMLSQQDLMELFILRINPYVFHLLTNIQLYK